jgi:hypothetical protein
MVDPWTPSPYRLFDLSGEVAVVSGATGVLGGVMARSLGRPERGSACWDDAGNGPRR